MKFEDNIKTTNKFKIKMDDEIKIGTKCFIGELGGWMEYDGTNWNKTENYRPENKEDIAGLDYIEE